jgi:hypothetical protein
MDSNNSPDPIDTLGSLCAIEECEHINLRILKIHTCIHCKFYIHPPEIGCSEYVDFANDPNLLQCKEGYGCRKKKASMFESTNNSNSSPEFTEMPNDSDQCNNCPTTTFYNSQTCQDEEGFLAQLSIIREQHNTWSCQFLFNIGKDAERSIVNLCDYLSPEDMIFHIHRKLHSCFLKNFLGVALMLNEKKLPMNSKELP